MKREEFMSLEWFKARVEKTIKKEVKKNIKKLGEQPIPEEDTANIKPYLNVKLINDSLVVVMQDGNIFTKPNATELDFLSVVNAVSREQVYDIIQDREVAIEKEQTRSEAEKLTNLAEGFNILGQLNDFEVKGKTIYLKGTSRSIPELLINKFSEVVGRHRDVEHLDDLETELLDDDEYQGLKNFFMWCCLNPRAEVANSLYDFLSKNGMKITKQGFFVALRNVVEVNKNDDTKIVDFVTNAYNKVKAVWKKSPSNYEVWRDFNDPLNFQLLKVGEFNTTDRETAVSYVGNLTTLYLDLPNMKENRYTDNWTRTFDIRIGQVVSMPSSKCDWSTQDCARAGLHFAGHTAPYVLCGDTTVFTLHNPMKVVGIGTEKGRCWEYLPFMTTTVKEADAIMNSDDFDFLQLDEEYAIRELEDLANKAKEGFTTESSKHEFNLPSISTAEINSIVLSLEKMKESITKRVSIID